MLFNLAQLLNQLWTHLTRRRKVQFFGLLGLMVVASFAESISIGAVYPLLTVLTNPSVIYDSHLGRLAISLLNISNLNNALFPIAIFFSFLVLVSGFARLLLIWASTRYAFAVGAELNIKAYTKTLYQPYEVHIARNSNIVINGILGKVHGLPYNIIMPLLNLISSTFLLILVFLALVLINPTVASISLIAFGSIYLFMGFLVRKKLKSNGFKIATESNKVLQLLTEGLGGIREVLIDGSQKLYTNLYTSADLSLRKSQASNSYIGSTPRILVETLGIILITGMAYVFAQSGNNITSGISVIGALALGAQRMLPNLQQIYHSWAALKGGEHSLIDSLQLLDQPVMIEERSIDCIKISFQKTIFLEKIYFSYKINTEQVLNDVTMVIEKGDRIGFVGKTGCGKSTLMDVVMGLLSPSSGSVLIDGRVVNDANKQAWRSHIAHVPQSIFLIDASIAENVAFGVPKINIDLNRLKEACQQARLDETIASWPEKYETKVGERGVRLSGGQRQRIGIARALYKKADVIIFDEATSALDSQTENEVMKAIENLGPEYTLLIVAHRISTLKICDKVVSLENGSIKAISPYDEFIKQELHT